MDLGLKKGVTDLRDFLLPFFGSAHPKRCRFMKLWDLRTL